MGLFEKELCAVCGGKISFPGSRKLEDGNLCKHCARRLSPFFREPRRSTTEEIRAQLTYREENEKKLKDFHPDRSFGTGEKIWLDLNAKQLIVTGAENFREENPDIIAASQILSWEKEIKEHEEEIFFTASDGNKKSYDPPRCRHTYKFRIILKIDSPWFDEISVDLNNGERPDSMESDLYLEQSMQLSELNSLLLQWTLPVRPGEHLLGPDVYTMTLRKQAIPMVLPAAITKTFQGSAPDEWKCSCGTANAGKFCTECGNPRP